MCADWMPLRDKSVLHVTGCLWSECWRNFSQERWWYFGERWQNFQGCSQFHFRRTHGCSDWVLRQRVSPLRGLGRRWPLDHLGTTLYLSLRRENAELRDRVHAANAAWPRRTRSRPSSREINVAVPLRVPTHPVRLADVAA